MLVLMWFWEGKEADGADTGQEMVHRLWYSLRQWEGHSYTAEENTIL